MKILSGAIESGDRKVCLCTVTGTKPINVPYWVAEARLRYDNNWKPARGDLGPLVGYFQKIKK